MRSGWAAEIVNHSTTTAAVDGRTPAAREGVRTVSAIAFTAFPARREQQSRESRRQTRADLDLIGQVEAALDVLHGKWRVHLLFCMARGVHRHSRLLDCLPGASKKMMTDTLRALQRDGLVERAVFAEVPVRVEYSLTPLGWSLTEPLMALADWGDAHRDDVTDARHHPFASSQAASAA
ncbi:MAG: helix-turn-helix transcriptional regulator [Actinobacteria bacterium]|nr:helix-turn-helix transcriptional regulator [Actinomycetota bacterium]